MSIGILTLHILIPGCMSLKEKRGRLKPLLARLHRQFNVSAAELDRLDSWQEAILGVALLSNDRNHTQSVLAKIPAWIEKTWPDIDLLNEQIELL